MKNIDELNNIGVSRVLDWNKIEVGDLLKLLISGLDEEQMVIVLKERHYSSSLPECFPAPQKNWKMFSWDVAAADGRKWVMETTTIGKHPSNLILTRTGEEQRFLKAKLVSRPEKA